LAPNHEWLVTDFTRFRLIRTTRTGDESGHDVRFRSILRHSAMASACRGDVLVDQTLTISELRRPSSTARIAARILVFSPNDGGFGSHPHENTHYERVPPTKLSDIS